ncbi:MAG: hypothetical protein VB878_16055, partial [Pirellulaceae bacterium]
TLFRSVIAGAISSGGAIDRQDRDGNGIRDGEDSGLPALQFRVGHDGSSRVPALLTGGLGGTLETGRVLDYSAEGDDNRKLCSMYLSIMDRMGVTLDRFGDADQRLSGL